MTSKNSFFLNMKENIKRRSAVLVAFAVYFFFAFPVASALKINNYLYQRSIPNEGTYERLYSDLNRLLGTNGPTMFFVVIMAVLCGIQGFSYLHHRAKIDLYHSLPVSKNRRFSVIYLNGILSFALLYLTALLLSVLVCSVMWKAPDAALLLNIAAGYGYFLLLYLCVYNLSILAVVLTGNTVITCFAVLIMMFYETIIRFISISYSEVFFQTYWNPNSTYNGLFTPVNQFITLMEGDRKAAGPLLLLAGYYIISLVLAWFAYRIHPAEGCSKAVAFPRLRPILKALLLVPAALLSTLVFHTITNKSLFFTIFGLIISLLLGHCILEIIFDFDIRSALRNRKSLLLCSLLSILFFCVYVFDLFGYDRYVPNPKQLVSAAWVPGFDASDFSGFAPYSYNFGYQTLSPAYESMQLADTASILALTELSSDFNSGENPVKSYLIYNLKGGRKVYRKIWVDYADGAEIMNTLYLSPEYKEASLVFNQEMQQLILETDAKLFYENNGLDYSGVIDKSVMEGLFEAYQKDYNGLSFTQAYTETPCGLLMVDDVAFIRTGNTYFTSYSFPVYPSFTHTLFWLEKHGILPWYEFDANKTTSVRVEGWFESNDSSGYNYIETTVTEPSQIRQLADVAQPRETYGLSFTMTAAFDVQGISTKANFYFPNFESIPDFILSAAE